MKNDFLFDKIMKRGKFIKNKDALTAYFKPNKIPQREEQREKILKNLAPFYNSDLGFLRNQYLYGGTGSGKTLCYDLTEPTRDALIKARNPNKKIYNIRLSGMDKTSLNEQYANELKREMNAKFGYRPSYFNIFNVILKKAKENNAGVIFFVDDFHKFPSNIRKDIITRHFALYTKYPEAVTIFASNLPIYRLRITEPEIMSRFDPQVIIFNKYNTEELREILDQRIKEAFNKPKLFDKKSRDKIINALKDTGNARKIIEILSECASQYAEIGSFDVDESIKNTFIKHELSAFMLSKNQQIATLMPFAQVDYIGGDQYLFFKEAYERYCKIMRNTGLKPYSPSNYAYNIDKFIKEEILELKFEKGQKKLRLLIDDEIVRNKIIKAFENLKK